MRRNFWLALSIISCCFGMSAFSMADGGVGAEDMFAVIEEVVELTPLETNLDISSTTPILAVDKRRIIVHSNMYELPIGEEVVTAIMRHEDGGITVIDGDGPRKLTAISGTANIFPFSVAIYRLHKQGLLPELTDTYYRYPYETVVKTPVKRSFVSGDSDIDFAMTVQGVTWYLRHNESIKMKIIDHFSGVVLVTTAGLRLLNFPDLGIAHGPNPPFAEIVRIIIGEDVMQGIINTYPHANLAEVVAFMEMGYIFAEFTIEEASQIDPGSMRDKVLQYFERIAHNPAHPNQEIQNILTLGMVIQMIGGNAAAAPMVPRGKKLTTWGAIKSGR